MVYPGTGKQSTSKSEANCFMSINQLFLETHIEVSTALFPRANILCTLTNTDGGLP